MSDEDLLRAQASRAHERANEAARLSAAARDENDDLRATIAKLREQIGVIEDSRTDRDVWAVELIAEHEIDCDPAADPYEAVARHIRQQKEVIAEYGRLVDVAVANRESVWRRLEAVAALIAQPIGGDS